jgi:hypothetical protein
MAIGAMAMVTMEPISHHYALPRDVPSGFPSGKAASAYIALDTPMENPLQRKQDGDNPMT